MKKNRNLKFTKNNGFVEIIEPKIEIKYSMEYIYCDPYEISFYEGLFGLICNTILLIIFQNIELKKIQ